MSYFHLRLRRLGRPSVDLGRIDQPDLDAAWAKAWWVALELRDELPARDAFDGLAVEIAEETGRMVLMIPISEAAAA
jgi:hypothetical protein